MGSGFTPTPKLVCGLVPIIKIFGVGVYSSGTSTEFHRISPIEAIYFSPEFPSSGNIKREGGEQK